ncbi:MAG TPA: hypothetical protein VK563_22395, partial [Puia sp.]|nr:hypothetical protein [Puia sp.]
HLLLCRVRRILKQKTRPDRPGARPVFFLLFALFAGLIGLSRPERSIVRIIRDNKQSIAGTGIMESPSGQLMRNRVPFKDKTPAPSPAALPKLRHAAPADIDAPELPEGFVMASNTVSGDNDEDPGYQQTAEYKVSDASVQSFNRAYSIGQTPYANVVVAPAEPDQEQPFVPNSSFSAGHTDDSAYQLLQLATAADKAARTEMERGIKVLRTEQVTLGRIQQVLSIRIKPATVTAVTARPDLRRIQKQLGEEQTRLKNEYRQKQEELLKQLQKAGKKKIIIYI